MAGRKSDFTLTTLDDLFTTQEMRDALSLDLVEKGLVTDQIVLTIGYDIENLTNPDIKKFYKGQVTTDRYGRSVPKQAHGTQNMEEPTSSTRLLMEGTSELYDRIVDKNLLVRRITIAANHIVDEKSVVKEESFEQLDLFTDYNALSKEKAEKQEALEKEKQLQKAMLSIKNRYGKNAVLKGMNFEEGATARERNAQIGGHKA